MKKTFEGFVILHPKDGLGGFGKTEEQCWDTVMDWIKEANGYHMTKAGLQNIGVQVVPAVVSWEEPNPVE